MLLLNFFIENIFYWKHNFYFENCIRVYGKIEIKCMHACNQQHMQKHEACRIDNSTTLLNQIFLLLFKVIRGGKLRKESCIPESIFSIMLNNCHKRDYCSRSSPNHLKVLLQQQLSTFVASINIAHELPRMHEIFFDKVKFK